MRNDVRRDRKASKIPNAVKLGFDLWTAKPGNWIQWEEQGVQRFGRVLGRVKINGSKEWLIEVTALLGLLDCPAIRWVKAEDVKRCTSGPTRVLLDFMFDYDWTAEKCRAMIEAEEKTGQPLPFDVAMKDLRLKQKIYEIETE